MGRGLEGTGAVLEGLGIPTMAENMDDPLEMVKIFYSVAMVLEFLGIETGLPTPADFVGYQQESQNMAAKRAEAGGTTSVWGQFLDTIRTVLGVDPSKRWG